MDLITLLSAIGVGMACAIIVRDWITGLVAVMFPILLFRNQLVVVGVAELTMIITLVLFTTISLVYILFISPHSKIPQTEAIVWSLEYRQDDEYMDSLASLDKEDVVILAVDAESAEELRELIVNA